MIQTLGVLNRKFRCFPLHRTIAKYEPMKGVLFENFVYNEMPVQVILMKNSSNNKLTTVLQ